MSIVTDILESAQGGKLVENLAQNFGLSPEQTRNAIEALAPALSLGLANAVKQPAVLEKVFESLVHPTHQAAYDDHAVAHGEDANALGQDVVAHLFGSGSAAGQVAQIAARDSGLRPDVLSKLLPVLASVVLGGLFKGFNSQGLGPILGQIVGGGGLGSILGQLAGGGPAASTPQSSGGGLGGGGLGGILGGLLGALLGGGGRPTPGAPSGQPTGSLPGGLDPAAVQSAIELIKKTLAPGGAGAGASAQNPGLQDVLDRVFPTK
jgi:hypothetical protein